MTAERDGLTRRESPLAGGATRRETPPTDGATRREAAAPDGRTRRESSGPPPGTTRREQSLTPDVSATWRRVNLPAPIAERYRVTRELESAGAQADILVCIDVETGDDVVVKLYRRGIAVDVATIATLQNSLRNDRHAREHVVPIIDFDSWQGTAWEIQEYFPEGSLAEFLATREQTAAAAAARTILVELADALSHLHRLDIVHRDLKPQNVLIRSLEPLDLVLADFGLAAEVLVSFDVRSLAGSFPYLAPEASSANTVSKQGDWWSLGVIMYEVLHGHHLFFDADTHLPLADAMIKHQLAGRGYVIESTGDERWDLLLAGLLTHDVTHRWGSEQVRRWLAGETPAVHVEARPRAALRTYPFGDATYTDPVALCAAFRTDWERAGSLFASRGDAVIDLRAWLQQSVVGNRAEHVFTGGFSPDRTLVRLQVIMDPGTTPAFRGRTLSDDGLSSTLKAALDGDRAALDWLRSLRDKQILSAWAAETPMPESVQLADSRLGEWWSAAETILDRIPADQSAVRRGVEDTIEPALLAAALDPSQRERLLQGGVRAVRQGGGGLPGWAEPLVRDLSERTDHPALAAVAAALVPLVRRQEQDRVAGIAADERARERREASDRRAERRRTSTRRFSTAVRGSGWPCAIAAIATGVGQVQLSGRSIQEAAIASGLIWLVVCLGWAARELVGARPPTRVGNVVFILVLTWGVQSFAVDLAGCTACLRREGLEPASWNVVPVALLAGAWAMRLINLCLEHALRNRPGPGGPVPADWLGGPARIIGGLAVTLEVSFLVNTVVTAALGASLTSSTLQSAPSWALEALNRASGFVAPVVGALPADLVTAVPPTAAVLALVVLVGGGDLRRWRPAALTAGRVLVIGMGLLAAAVWIYTLGAVLLLLGYLVIGVIVVGVILWIVVMALGG